MHMDRNFLARQWRRTFNPSTPEQREAGLWVWGQSGLQNKFQDRQGSRETLSQTNKQNQKNKQTKPNDYSCSYQVPVYKKWLLVRNVPYGVRSLSS